MIDGEVKIIDEFTGRILEGRRWSDGLHQAVEAKEGVRIREENQTLATITLQNYFRLYDKLSGMTGTALTEATEFMKIYEIPVVEIDTHRPMIRDDHNDQIYKTKRRQVDRRSSTRSASATSAASRCSSGRSRSRSRRCSSDELDPRRDRARGPEREARVRRSARARRSPRRAASGAVTIATNMAGRGVDIKLGGDPEQLAVDELRKLGLTPEHESWEEELAEHTERFNEQTQAEGDEVREVGGLFICGTERHESRRIDNQLRGRSGRQGDPGESRFFLSAEDDLIRLFAGERIYKILDRLGPVDEEGQEYPLEAKMLTRTIENAQKKVEQQNFLIRKRVLEYDDVMNEQRRVVYKYRREILEGRDMSDVAHEELEEVVTRHGRDLHAGRDLRGLGPRRARGPRGRALAAGGSRSPSSSRETANREQIAETLIAGRARRLRAARGGVRRRADALPRAPDPAPDHRQPLARAPLRDGLPARGHPPPRLRPDRPAGRVQERGLHDVPGADGLDLGGVRPGDLPRRGQHRARPGARRCSARGAAPRGAATSSTRAPPARSGHRRSARRRPGSRRQPRPAPAAAAATAAPPAAGNGQGGVNPATVVKSEDEKIGRNDPCWCGSGKKYKKCHGA